ncbi:TPA: hypothetical protein L4G78_001636 [Pseudomonas aeruginosa]|nr:hypothetical protein [Pseudomonas aeruginosa]
MGMNRPSQKLLQELLDMAATGDELVTEVSRIAERCDEMAAFLLRRLLGRMYDNIVQLESLAEEVRAGRIVRKSPDEP